jgi:hypothetical protein
MKETFLSHNKYLWLRYCTLAILVSAIFYYFDSSIGGRNGGTVLGYTLGTISTAGILYLMWYGIRKRSYYSKTTTLKAVLSSHVWIGVALLILVPLHSGFSFGTNVHTLAYALMVATILSGIWGVFMFREYPYALSSQRGGGTISQLSSSVYLLSQDIADAAAPGKRSDEFMTLVRAINFSFSPSLLRSLARNVPAELDAAKVAKLLEQIPSGEQAAAINFIELINKKRALVVQLQEEARAQALIRGWLALHLPLSFALCIAVAIHIFAVFYFR